MKMTDASGRLDVLVVTEYGEGTEKKNRWNKVGAAFRAKEGEGYTVVLDFPVGVTKLVLRPPKEPANDRPNNAYRGGSRSGPAGREDR
jgi:hypothetical protein